MEHQTLLVIEDDLKIRNLLRNVLEGEGYTVLLSEDGSDVLDLIKSQTIDLFTLDIHLGPKNGLDLVREIKRVSSVPIIMITGLEDVMDRVIGLEVGADDYITKPFHIREVIARVRSVLRRTGRGGAENTNETPRTATNHCKAYCFDGLIATPDTMELLDRTGKVCGLTSGDFKLLAVFLERPKRVLSRDQLMDLLGGLEWSPLDRAIDNQVARLRKKIEREPSQPKLIKTVRGVGYTLACEVQITQPSGGSAKSA